MAIYEVYSQSVTFKYKSTLCSKSTIFSVATTVFALMIPFLLAYRSHGFWLRISSYREQPQVSFKHLFVLYLETEEPDSPVLCSNLPMTREFDSCVVIKSREEDSNQDGQHDKLTVEFEVEIPSNLSVFSTQLVLIFDYKLQKQCELHMESAAFIQFSSGLPFAKLEVMGDLKLVQKKLLKSEVKDLRYDRSVFDIDGDLTSMWSLQEAMKNYGTREVTTSIQNLYQTWTRGILLNEPFRLTVNIFYGEDTVHHVPPFWQIMKWAWMQYLALVIISAYICRAVKNYAFANHLVPAFREIPWKSYA